MKIALTDSGFGGLGIAAKLYEYLDNIFPAEPVEIIYVNGLPHEYYGYNSIPKIQDKVNTFGSLLQNIENRLQPDFIVITCNTLSVLFDKTDIYKSIVSKTIDILKFGTITVLERYQAKSDILLAITGSETTISSGIHVEFFRNYPAFFKTVLPIANTELITAIEDDSTSEFTKYLVYKCIRQMTDELQRADYSAAALILACTHFPYVEHLFRNAFNHLSVKTDIINPNLDLLEYLKSLIPVSEEKTQHPKSIQIISKTAVEPTRMRSISSLIKEISNDTITALHNYRYIPDFYDVDSIIFKQ
ncbi:MAG: hypothetical protein ACP5FZ_06305 [Fidelibacterota bacterium]